MAAVVVDVLLRGPAMFQDVVVVPVIYDKQSSGLDHGSEVLEAQLVVPG